MAKFKVLSRVDAFVDYVAEIEAETAEQAVELACECVSYGEPKVLWEKRGVVEFDARHIVALNDDNIEIEGTARGDFV